MYNSVAELIHVLVEQRQANYQLLTELTYWIGDNRGPPLSMGPGLVFRCLLLALKIVGYDTVMRKVCWFRLHGNSWFCSNLSILSNVLKGESYDSKNRSHLGLGYNLDFHRVSYVLLT